MQRRRRLRARCRGWAVRRLAAAARAAHAAAAMQAPAAAAQHAGRACWPARRPRAGRPAGAAARWAGAAGQAAVAAGHGRDRCAGCTPQQGAGGLHAMAPQHRDIDGSMDGGATAPASSRLLCLMMLLAAAVAALRPAMPEMVFTPGHSPHANAHARPHARTPNAQATRPSALTIQAGLPACCLPQRCQGAPMPARGRAHPLHLR